MELALATKTAKARARNALIVAVRQVLLLIAIAYGIAYLVPACMGLASRQVTGEPRTGALRDSGLELHAELVCESAPPGSWARAACNLPK